MGTITQVRPTQRTPFSVRRCSRSMSQGPEFITSLPQLSLFLFQRRHTSYCMHRHRLVRLTPSSSSPELALVNRPHYHHISSATTAFFWKRNVLLTAFRSPFSATTMTSSWKNLFSRSSTTTASTTAASSTTTELSKISLSDEVLKQRLRAALWGFFAGDALAAPTHWYYGGIRQIQADYGPAGITDYTKPKFDLAGSILNKSNLNGGGRATQRNHRKAQKTIVGNVILHGKQDYWAPNKQIHYHATLHKGENTLEASLGRVLLRSMTQNKGKFDANHFRQAYIDFMTTPSSHNDTYASTCHRMFFANLAHKGKDPVDCPDDDHHNVLTVDGLVLPTLVALATAILSPKLDQAGQAAAACVGVTRRSVALEKAAFHWGVFIGRALLRPENEDNDSNSNTDSLTTLLEQLAKDARLSRQPQPRNQLTACYLDSAWPALLDNLLLFREKPLWDALLANANTGGENVHRGACLGAAMGVFHKNDASSSPDQPLPAQLTHGLYHHDELESEIEAFITVLLDQRRRRVVIDEQAPSSQ